VRLIQRSAVPIRSAATLAGPGADVLIAGP
jgi:hypothetical protein